MNYEEDWNNINHKNLRLHLLKTKNKEKGLKVEKNDTPYLMYTISIITDFSLENVETRRVEQYLSVLGGGKPLHFNIKAQAGGSKWM